MQQCMQIDFGETNFVISHGNLPEVFLFNFRLLFRTCYFKGDIFDGLCFSNGYKWSHKLHFLSYIFESIFERNIWKSKTHIHTRNMKSSNYKFSKWNNPKGSHMKTYFLQIRKVLHYMHRRDRSSSLSKCVAFFVLGGEVREVITVLSPFICIWKMFVYFRDKKWNFLKIIWNPLKMPSKYMFHFFGFHIFIIEILMPFG